VFLPRLMPVAYLVFCGSKTGFKGAKSPGLATGGI
jgi:hypothetical protein